MQTSDQPSDSAEHVRTRATLVGTVAVLLWSSLAPLTAMAHGIPPLELLAMTFGIAFLCGLTWLLATGGLSSVQRMKQPLSYLGFATAALFGYHVLYFAALSLAPPAQASLIAYLWPLLTVLFSAWNSRDDCVRTAHIVGALLGFAGTALLVLSGNADHTALPYRPLGLLAALSCAVIWSSYSVLNRHFRDVPSEAMIGICGLVALLGWGAHFLVDNQTVLPGVSQWFAIGALGVGPIGLAFLAWDYGTKHGHVSTLGTVSYAAPVLSTLLLVMLGYTPASLSLLATSALVVGGAWTATHLESLKRSGAATMMTESAEHATWTDFERVGMRVGTIRKVELFPEARKPAYKLWIDFGPFGIKSSSAQLTTLYTLDDLLGRQVVCATGLGPKRVAGFKSEVLVTGFAREDGAIILATPERAVADGSPLC